MKDGKDDGRRTRRRKMKQRYRGGMITITRRGEESVEEEGMDEGEGRRWRDGGRRRRWRDVKEEGGNSLLRGSTANQLHTHTFSSHSVT